MEYLLILRILAVNLVEKTISTFIVFHNDHQISVVPHHPRR
jgi:hypothetical protein